MVDTPLARSPIFQAPPVLQIGGWEVSARISGSRMRLIDCTSCEKLLVRISGGSPWTNPFDTELGRARRDQFGRLIAGIAPEQWLFIGARGVPLSIRDLPEYSDGARPLVTITSLTHSTALIRLVGDESAQILRKLCGINFDSQVTPNHSALRSSIGRIVVSLIRDDVAAAPNGSIPSYLIFCDRSAGQYLFNLLLDAGQEFKVDVQGFSDDASLTAV